MSLDQSLSQTERTRVRRHAERAQSDRADLYRVLDAGMICHLGVLVDGSPVVIPTAYGRIADTLFVHASSASRALRAADGQEICVCVTHLDGLVCARAAFTHSINYRSAVIFGTARLVTSEPEKVAGLRAVAEQLIPGRWQTVREPVRKEVAKTSVLAVPLAEASVKVRTGPPVDEPADVDPGVWAGVVPVGLAFGQPWPDASVRPGVPVPEDVQRLAGRATLGLSA